MNKIFSVMCLGIIGGLYLIVLGGIYIIGLVFLLVNEILGTKKFMNKLKQLTNIVTNEFKDTINSFKSVLELV